MKKVTLLVFIILLAITQVFALEGFERKCTIPVPEKDLNNGGIGNMISGVDIDGDGYPEIYLVNDNWMDGDTEVIPRLYKLENSGTGWEVVWQTTLEPFYQNTWPCLSIADLDQDGKEELVWGPVNSTAIEANPPRVVVYEHDEDDAFGISDGAGGYLPNSSWTIVSEDDVNLRPMDWEIADIDDDGVDEIIFADRKGTTGGYFFGVMSVDDIPDDGAGTETWTLEVSAKDFPIDFNADAENKWDVAVIGNTFYAFCEVEISKVTWNGSAWEYTSLAPLAGGSPNQSARAIDLDNDGTKEIIAGVYDWGDDEQKSIVLLQEEGDGLTRTPLVNVGEYFVDGSRGLWGIDYDDIDGDGYYDIIFGSREGVVNGQIFRLAYRGGDITDPANYEFTVIDQEFVASGGVWSNINVANLDDDPEQEVLYASSSSYGGSLGVPDTSSPIIVLDYTEDWQGLVVAEEVLFDGAIPDNLMFKPGKILDNGNTIWFVGVDGSAKTSYVFRSVDGGKTFTYNATPIDGRAAQMDAYDEDVALVACANGKVFKTSDGGATFSEAYSYSLGLGNGWFDGLRIVDGTAIAFGDEASDGAMHFAKSTDMGETWTQIEGMDYGQAAYGYYTYGTGSCVADGVYWAVGFTSSYTGSWIFKTTDQGETWTTIEIDTSAYTSYIRSIAFVDANVGFITSRYGEIAKSTDGGETWTQIDLPPGGEWTNSIITVPGSDKIYAMDDAGVFSSMDHGETWKVEAIPPEGKSDYYVSGVFSTEDTGYFFTYYNQAHRKAGQVPTSIDYNDNVNIVEKYVLHQNYPNPFNPTTTIAFDIPRSDNIKVVIYDMLGQKIRTLVNANISAGYHRVEWDGRDTKGQMVSTGVYLYQLQTPNMIKTRKMTFIK